MWPRGGVIFKIFSSWLPHGHQPVRIDTDFSTKSDSRSPTAVLGVNSLVSEMRGKSGGLGADRWGWRHQETQGRNLPTDREAFQYFNNQYDHRQNVSLASAKTRDWIVHSL